MKHAVASRPLLLLLDGHSSHYEPATIRFAKKKKNDVIILCLPPHTTHETQPLDCSLFRPRKIHWLEAVHDFYQKNPGKVISKLNFSGIFRQAWLQSVTAEVDFGKLEFTPLIGMPFRFVTLSCWISNFQHPLQPQLSSTVSGASSTVSALPPAIGYLLEVLCHTQPWQVYHQVFPRSRKTVTNKDTAKGMI